MCASGSHSKEKLSQNVPVLSFWIKPDLLQRIPANSWLNRTSMSLFLLLFWSLDNRRQNSVSTQRDSPLFYIVWLNGPTSIRLSCNLDHRAWWHFLIQYTLALNPPNQTPRVGNDKQPRGTCSALHVKSDILNNHNSALGKTELKHVTRYCHLCILLANMKGAWGGGGGKRWALQSAQDENHLHADERPDASQKLKKKERHAIQLRGKKKRGGNH